MARNIVRARLPGRGIDVTVRLGWSRAITVSALSFLTTILLQFKFPWGLLRQVYGRYPVVVVPPDAGGKKGAAIEA